MKILQAALLTDIRGKLFNKYPALVKPVLHTSLKLRMTGHTSMKPYNTSRCTYRSIL